MVPEGLTQPRAKLFFAAYLNASACHVVKLSLGKVHTDQIKLTDSQVVLHWFCCENRVLKQWVRNQVINRLADCTLWRYVHTTNMTADIGTRKGASLNDVDSNSLWINGFDWMSKDRTEFPVFTVDVIKLEPTKVNDLKNEYLKGDSKDFIWTNVLRNRLRAVSNYAKNVFDELKERSTFSNYEIDPNKFRFRKNSSFDVSLD